MSKRGFTLIELIMVITIVGIIGGVIAPFVANSINYWILVKDEREVISSARLALNRMVREIRQIKDTASITAFTDTDFAFTRLKADGSEETVRFYQSGSSLLRNTRELSDKLQGPGGLTFRYLDENGDTTGTQSDIRMVRVQLTLQSGDVAVTIRSLGRFRNI